MPDLWFGDAGEAVSSNQRFHLEVIADQDGNTGVICVAA